MMHLCQSVLLVESQLIFVAQGAINMSLFNGQTQLALLASKSVNQHHRAGGQDKIVH